MKNAWLRPCYGTVLPTTAGAAKTMYFYKYIAIAGKQKDLPQG